MFKGSITALVTPFKNNALDIDAFERIIMWQINSGTSALVVNGTTGEAPTLSDQEYRQLVLASTQFSGGQIPIIVGTGSNCTAKTIELTLFAQKAGAQAALIMLPYYNKPTQSGLYAHFKAIHDATDIPILIYEHPGRCGVSLDFETLTQLAQLPRIVGIKDCTGDLSRPLKLRSCVPESFCMLTGNDDDIVPYLAQGGDGCISVASNIAPELCTKLHKAWEEGDFATVDKMNRTLLPLWQAMACESNPIPVKYAAHLLELCTDEIRLPLVLPCDTSKAMIKQALQDLKILTD